MFKPKDTAKLEERARRADEARLLMGNPMLKDALERMERDIVGTMKNLKPNDAEGLDAMWRELRALERFKQKLATTMAVGDEARKSLMQRAKELM